MEAQKMPEHIIQQDVLLDDIKEYRKIFRILMERLNNSELNECKNIIQNSQDYINIIPDNYEYEYKGIDNILDDVDIHKRVIEKIMNELELSNNNECKEMYNTCYNTDIYQEFFLETIERS